MKYLIWVFQSFGFKAGVSYCWDTLRLKVRRKLGISPPVKFQGLSFDDLCRRNLQPDSPLIMRFTTSSGSLYEVDPVAKKVRRLIGKDNPTPRMGKDGEWRSYREIHPWPLQKGQGVVIAWGSDTELMDETKAIVADGGFGLPLTTTSPVVEIDETLPN